MSRVAAIGEAARVTGYAMAGVKVLPAADPAAARAAWDGLPDDVGCVLLTPSARVALAGRLDERPDVIWAVIPRVD